MMVRIYCAVGAALLLTLPVRVGAQVTADVPYVTTPWNVVETMLDMAQVTSADNLIDLGSGDGRIVIEAVKKRGARGFGIELNPHLVKIAKDEAQKQGVAARANFAEGNLFTFNPNDVFVSASAYAFAPAAFRAVEAGHARGISRFSHGRVEA